MKKILVWTLLVLVSASCGKKEGSSSKTSAQPPRVGSTDPRHDYAKPYLTEDKMTKFIDSMKEERNPLEVIFKEGGQMRGLIGMKEKIEEFNAFARKYGFKDYEDYTAIWGRITVGQMQIWAEGMKKGTVEMLEKSIQSAEQELKKPNLSPDMRKMYEEQIASSKQSLADLQKQDRPGLNDADLTLVKRYNAQIDEAAKRYRKKAS